MIFSVRKTPAAVILMAALAVTTYGCDSNSNSLPVSDTGADENTQQTGTDDTTGTGDQTGAESTGGTDTSGESGVEVPPTDQTPPDNVADPELEARYSARFVSAWSAETHPTNFPAANPHFSPLTGAVHNEQVIVWERGQNATDGIEEMAETGSTALLLPEIQSAIDQGYALSIIEGGSIELSPGATSVEFLVNRDYPLVTLVSMLAPSPDWFIGVNSQSMLDENGAFAESMTIELNLYDSGTDGGVTFTSADDDIPRSPVDLVNSFPSDSDFIEGRPAVGALIITKMP